MAFSLGDMGFNSIADAIGSASSAFNFDGLGQGLSTDGLSGDSGFWSNITGKDLLGASGGILGGLGSMAGGLFSIFGGNDNSALAKKQFEFSKQAYLTNLANQIKTYNNSLSDKINGRYSEREMSQEEKDKIIKDKSL